MLQIAKQTNDITRKYGALRVEYFQLSSTENMIDWTNISKTVSANKRRRRFGWSKSYTETANTEMNTWQCVEMMKI